MNEEYLQGFFNNYVKSSKPDADYNDWVSKIKDNDQYKQGMFNTYVKSSRPDADYNDWNSKIFGASQQGGLASFGKTLQSTVSDLIPQSLVGYVQRETSKFGKDINDPNSLISKINQVTGNEINPNEVQQLQSNSEQYVQQQKQEAAQKLQGVTQSYKQIHNLSSLASYIGQALGQGLGQIPAAVATSGASSYLMEASEIYDSQLDLLAAKHGISREEVIKRGLDKPAEGEAYAILAAALDSFSAGSVLNLFKKQATKELTKEVTESTLKKIGKNFAKGAAPEFATEAAQGVLERLGAAKGAGVEANITPSDILNEGLAGAIGGGGIHAVTTNPFNKKEEAHPAQNVIDDYNQFLSSIDTGDNNTTLDQLEQGTAAEVNKLFDKAHEIAGTKKAEEIEASRKADQESFIQKIYEAFNQAPAINPVQFTTEATQVPKFNPQTLEEEGTQPAESFKMVLPKGEATGTIAGGIASLNEIYANKDAEGNPLKGGNLYGNLIEQLRLKGIQKLRVGAQSPASSNVLQKLIDKGELQVDPRGDVTWGDRTIHTQFNIVEKANDRQNQQGVQSEVGERQEPIQPQPIESPSSQEIAPSGIFQAPQESVRENTKEQLKAEKVKEAQLLKAERELEDKKLTLQTRMENALKRAPSLRVAALEAIAEKADKLGLTKLRDKAAKLADKELESQNLKEEEKVIKKKQRTPRMSAEQRKEFLASKKEEQRLALEDKKKTSKMLQPVEGTKLNVKQAKETYLKEIAYLRETGDKNYRKMAEKYIKFREDNHLKEISLERALEESKAEHYTQSVKKRLGKEKEARRAVSSRIESMKKAGEPVEKIAKVKLELEESLRQDIEKRLGIKLGSLSGVNLEDTFTTLQFKKDLEAASGETPDVSKIEKSSVNELSFRLKQFPTIKAQTAARLLESIGKALEKQGKQLHVYHYNTGGLTSGGFYGLSNKHHMIMTTGKLSSGNFHPKYIDTLLHEIMHGYTAILSEAARNTDDRFSRAANKVYDSGKNTLRSSLKESIEATSKGKLDIGKQNYDILTATMAYIKDFYGSDKFNHFDTLLRELYEGEQLDQKKLLDEIVNSVYGFSDTREMLSELSNNAFVHLLSVIPSDNKSYYKTGKVHNSLLKELFEHLRTFVKKHFSGPSVFDDIDSLVNEYSSAYEEKPITTGFSNPYFHIPTLKDIAYQYPSLSPKEVIAYREKLAKNILKEFETMYRPGRKLNVNEKIIANIAKTLERRSEIKTVEEVRAYLKRVNARLTAERQLGEAHADIAFQKIEALRRKRLINEAEFKRVIDQARQNPKYNTSFKYKKDVEDFASVDVQAVPNDKLKLLNDSIQLLSQNAAISKAGYDVMINYGKKLQKLRALTKVANKLDKNVGALTHQFANPASYASIVARYDKNASTQVLKHIYGGMMETFAHMTNESHDFVTSLSKLADKNNLRHSNLTKIGIYGSIFSTKNDPSNKEAWEKEVKDNARHALESAINKKSAKEQNNYKSDLKDKEIDKEIEIATEINSKLEKSPTMEGILSKEEKEFYDKFREFAQNHESDFERNTVGTWGNENYEHRYNYFPTQAQGKVSGLTKDESDPLIRDNQDNLMDALNKHDIKSDENNLYSKKVWSQYKRINPKGYFYNFDALNIAERWSKNMLYDLYATTELKALNRLFRDQEFQKAISTKTRNGFLKQLRSIAGVGNKYDSEVGKALKAAFSVRDKLYTATLATSGQIASQSSSGFAAAAVISAMAGLNAPKIFGKAVAATFKSSFYKDTSKLQEFLKKEGMGIQNRDILFEKYLTSDNYRNYILSRGQKITNEVERLTEFGLRQGDKLGARIVWFAAYFNAGGTLESPNKSAILEAERQVGLMQNMSDLAFSAPIFKYDSMAKRMLVGMFYAYKSFAVNSYLNILYSSRYAATSSEARQVLAAQLASVIAYHAVAATLVKPFYDAIVDAISGGDDDDEDKKKSYSKMEGVLAESLWDTGALSPLFGMAAPSAVDAMSRYVFSKTLAPKIYGNEFDGFDQYVDNPIYSMKNAEDAWKNAFGPGYREIGEASIELAKLLEMQAKADEYFDSVEDASKREEKWKELEMMILTDILASSSMTPMRGDMKRIMQGVLRKQRAQSLQENKLGKGKGKGGNSNSEGTEREFGETPEFQEKNYELINQ